MFALLIPVLAYGVLCAILGFWVRDNVLTHWPTLPADTAQYATRLRVRLLGGLSALVGRIGR